MILHPAILALLAGQALVCTLLLAVAATAAKVLRRWDFSSASSGQLELERRTTMISTLAALALRLQAAALLLFVFVLEDIHPLFTGAMCATGSLNANPVGWWALLLQVALLVGAGVWLALHRLDVAAEDFPLVRVTSLGILIIAPLAVLDLALLGAFFLGLDPQVVTSCCGSLFSEAGSGVAAGLAALPPGPMRIAFFGSLIGLAAANLASRRSRSAGPRIAGGAIAAAFLPVGLASVVSFLSVAIYRLPTHHCPFDLLQPEYGYVGYPLYLGIFGTVIGNLLPAVGLALRRRPSLAGPLARAEREWLRLGLVSALLTAGVAAWPTVAGLRLE